jgi:hypothetical protein
MMGLYLHREAEFEFSDFIPASNPSRIFGDLMK